MRKLISIALIGVMTLGVSFATVKVNKVEKNQIKTYRVEKDPSEYRTLSQGSTKIVMPNTRNAGYFSLVDSSTNGFGMVASETRPLFVDPENTAYWFSSYRQYCGENTTHGQLGGAFSEDGMDWTTYPNLNSNGNPPWGGGGVGGSGVGQARYPSAVGTEDMPIAMWNEYTGDTSTGSAYGGRPYYAYDEFGWDGGSFAFPVDTDLLWETDGKDLWVGSVSISYDDDLGMPVINAAYNDWTRGDRWLFHSEYVDDATIIMGEEQKVIDEVNDLVGGDDTGSFNTSPMLSCTPEGICGVGVVGLFLGADNDASDVSNYHTGIFKMSDDHGASWYGGSTGDASLGHASSTDGDGYYFIPDNVWNDLVSTQFNYEYVDECEGTVDLLNDFWTYYNADFKIDREGNPHWVIQVLPCGAEFCYYADESGFYHFTIDKDYLDNPGPLNTSTGWNWSHVVTGSLTWAWPDMTGESYVWNTHGSLAFSVEDPDIMYVVANVATEGDFMGDPSMLEDPCYYTTWEDYPYWSEDLYVIKSEDGGETWWNPLNVSNTPDETGGVCPNGYPKCDPAETYPHAAQWATDSEVYVQYQMPNWDFNEIGDLSHADFMNRVYIGYATVDDDDIPEYGPGATGCYAEAGDVTGDSIINVLDIISLVNHVLGISTIDDTCAADYNADGIVNILDVVGMVNYILGIGLQSNLNPAATEVIINTGSNLHLESNGNVQAVHLILSTENELDIEWADGLFHTASFYNNELQETSLIAIATDLNLDQIATIEGAYTVKEASVVSLNDETKEPMLLASDRVVVDGTVTSENALPNGYRVSNAYPNPFNPTTSFKIDLDNESFVSIKAYNILGQMTAEIFSGNMNGYDNFINWDASNIASGIYFIKVQVDNNLESQKVLLVK